MKNITEKHCICATCGTMLSNPITGFCKNGHDDWLEPEDGIEDFERASKNTGYRIKELIDLIKRGDGNKGT